MTLLLALIFSCNRYSIAGRFMRNICHCDYTDGMDTGAKNCASSSSIIDDSMMAALHHRRTINNDYDKR
jgi:hypothetical protein